MGTTKTKRARNRQSHPAPTEPLSILSLDMSLECIGWAHAHRADPGAPWQRQHGSFRIGELADHRMRRADLALKWLSREVMERRPDYLVVEEPHTSRYDNAGTHLVLYGLHFSVHLLGHRCGLHVRDVSRLEVVKSLLGWSLRPTDPNWVPARGKRPKMRGATKAEVRSAVEARHGITCATHDEADAVAAIDLVLAELAGTGPVVPAHGISDPRQETIDLDAVKGTTGRKVNRALRAIGLGVGTDERRSARGRGPLYPKGRRRPE